jgi:glutamate racemase
MLPKNAPIGVFDSGLGGISVLRELVKLMPQEDYLYFGDSANAPYGPRSTAEVQKLTCASAEHLLRQGCKALVIACNTATSAAIHLLREQYTDIPVIGIEPALKPAVVEHDHPNVLVLATEMTLREEKFHRLMQSYEDQAMIYPQPAPGIVEWVEQGKADGPEINAYLHELLEPYRQMRIDAVVLGCTHFPFAQDAVVRNLEQPVAVYDGGPGTARETRRRLAQVGLLSDREGKGTVHLTNSRADAVPLAEALFAL